MKYKYGKVITLVSDILDAIGDALPDDTNDADIWDNGEDDGIDYSDLGGYDYVDGEEETEEDRTYHGEADILNDDTEARWNAIDRLSGKVKKGDCLYCGKKNGMSLTPRGNYTCKYCHDFVPEEVYLQWYAGFDVYIEEV